jgi:hypothetical protein
MDSHSEPSSGDDRAEDIDPVATSPVEASESPPIGAATNQADPTRVRGSTQNHPPADLAGAVAQNPPPDFDSVYAGINDILSTATKLHHLAIGLGRGRHESLENLIRLFWKALHSFSANTDPSNRAAGDAVAILSTMAGGEDNSPTLRAVAYGMKIKAVLWPPAPGKAPPFLTPECDSDSVTSAVTSLDRGSRQLLLSLPVPVVETERRLIRDEMLRARGWQTASLFPSSQSTPSPLVKTPLPKKRMDVFDANAELARSAAKDPDFKQLSIHDMAKRIGCSPATVKKTEFWGRVLNEQPSRKRTKVAAAKEVQLTEVALENTEQKTEPDVVNDLIARERMADEEKAVAAVQASKMPDDHKAAMISNLRNGALSPFEARKIAEEFPMPRRTRRHSSDPL